jgi:hypothetical protein
MDEGLKPNAGPRKAVPCYHSDGFSDDGSCFSFCSSRYAGSDHINIRNRVNGHSSEPKKVSGTFFGIPTGML